jgi:putative peptide zinc metalloprotease protein
MSRFLSPSWHRVAELRPRLAEQARIHRHRYRNKLWYVIDDRAAGRVHRFTPAAYQFICRMDGRRSVDDIWKEAVRILDKDAPGQEDVIRLLGQLHANDLLKCDVIPDTAELFTRFGKQSRSLLLSNLKNPVSIRLPLWDPDRFLRKTLPWVRPIFTRLGFAVWLAVVLMGLVLAGQHWNELTENITDRVLATENLLVLGLTFPVVKAIHEFGHAYSTRVYGGEVHEMGILLLALMPIPYVDATASVGFRSKWQRVLVGAAGMMAELFLASLALLAWTLLEPGLARSVLFDAMVIAGVSTLVFNGNPLLRYDGYYILSDLIEIPNLGMRANRYWTYLANRYLFAVRNAKPGDASTGERRWFVLYAPAAYAYRILVMVSIAIFLANEFFIVGVALALWSCISMFAIPVWKGLSYVLFDPRLNSTRGRAIRVTLGLAAAIAVLLGLVPMPLRTQSEGILWRPEQAEVRAGTSGFVRRVLLPSGTPVEAGEPLLECEEPMLEAEIEVYRAKVEEIKARRMAEWIEDRVKAEITRDELVREEANLARAEERAAKLIVRSPARGRFVLTEEADLPGRFLRQGDLVGFVVDGSGDIVRVVVPQDDIDLVRRSVREVAVRFSHRVGDVRPARIIREVPAARNELPSPALGTEGGGRHALDPREPNQDKSLESLFQLDLALPETAASGAAAMTLPPYGSRVHVRFEHRPEPLARQWWRRLRQMFLSRLQV